MRKVIIIGLLCVTQNLMAQDNPFQQKYDEFKSGKTQEYIEFRKRCNQTYAEFMRRSWKAFGAEPPVDKPKEEKITVVPFPEEDFSKPVDTTPVTISNVIPSMPIPRQPVPIVVIPEIPEDTAVVVSPEHKYVTCSFHGTECKVRLSDEHRFGVKNCKENTVADAWLALSEEKYNNAIRDCLEFRLRHQLCDWAYLQMLKTVADEFCGKGTNEATMLTAFLYCQSGYKMRLGAANNRLYMLYGTDNRIYGQLYYILDGEFYFPLDCDEKYLNICAVAYPKEQELSLLVTNEQDFEMKATEVRTIKSLRYPDIAVETCVNKNLIDFYDGYPEFEVDNNFMTRWAMYANTPMSQIVKDKLYPKLKECIDGKSQLDAVNRLLNFVQTGFVYEYDDKVWGRDRAFFADETLYYPYCDCEDRSILFSRLVRDLLGMKVVLVYYPGHLATAVCFDTEVEGDFIPLDDEKYTICDPTYINAGVGLTMRGFDNSEATVMLLE